jgi:pimeloyl-ACP methyl ester carboxylesterase
MRALVNDVEIEWEQTGADGAPLVLLIAGMGAQLTMWPQEFRQRIAAAGFRVVCFDNRDSGLSSGFEHVASAPKVLEAFARSMPPPVAYRIDDMARDTLGLIHALGRREAHIVGMSMGGVIGQLLAINHPEHVASFVQIASTTGEPHLPGPDPRISAFLGEGGDATGESTAIERAVRFLRLLAGSAFARTDEELHAAATRDFRRNRHHDGALRQMVAVMSEPPRGVALEAVAVPTLVIHGTDDLMVPLAAGEDTASRLRRARLEIVPGMGHNVEPALSERLAASIVGHIAHTK